MYPQFWTSKVGGVFMKYSNAGVSSNALAILCLVAMECLTS